MIKVKREFVTGDFEMLLNIDSIMYVSASYNSKDDSCYIGGANGEFKVMGSVDSIHDKIKQARKDRNNK